MTIILNTMIGAKKLWKQASVGLLRNLPQGKQCEKKSLLGAPMKALVCNQRFFAAIQDQKPASKEIKAEDTGGYYKERLKNKDDPYYDPFNPYVWMHVCPRSWQPYLRFCRIDQMFGRLLLLNPHLWGIAIASPLGGLPSLINVWLFTVGSLFSHATSCAWDDFADVPVDRTNERTKRRPLVAGTMGRGSALAIMTLLAGGSFGILSMLSPVAIKIGLIATPCIIAYPYMKRFFQYPQVFLAFALNLGVFMGYAAVAGSICWPVCIPMYIGGVAYTIFYDSIYAFQDIEADTKANTFSTSQKFAAHAKGIMSGLALTTVAMHTAAGFLAGLNPAFLSLMGVGGAHLAWQTWKLDVKNGPLCDHLLNISYRYGLILFFAYALGIYLTKGKKKAREDEIKKKNEKGETLSHS